MDFRSFFRAFLIALATAVCSFQAALAQSSFWDQFLRISFVDVGQGDAIWIQTPKEADGTEGQNIIIDGGPDRKDANRLLVYMKKFGLDEGEFIDYIISTHPHTDHYKGLIDVLEKYEVGATIEPGFPKGGQYDEFVNKAKAEHVDGQQSTSSTSGKMTLISNGEKAFPRRSCLRTVPRRQAWVRAIRGRTTLQSSFA